MKDVLAGLVAAFGRLGTRWYILGAQAAVIHGRPRMTADLDVAVELGAHDVKSLLAALDDSGFAPAFEFDDAFVSATRVVPVVHRDSGMPVDITLAGPGLEELFLDAAEPVRIADIEVPVIRAEHLVVTKILAGRPRDIEDVEGVVAVRAGTLDREAIEQLLGLLESALDQSDLLPRWHAIVAGVGRARRPR
jgi:hypothetical protein